MSAFSPQQQSEITALITAETDRLGTLIRQLQGPVATAFLQLATAGDFKVAFGSGTWTWPGGQQSSGVTTTTHGLGRTPLIAFALPNADQGATEALVGTAFSATATTFGSRGSSKVHTNYPAATTATFWWLVIG